MKDARMAKERAQSIWQTVTGKGLGDGSKIAHLLASKKAQLAGDLCAFLAVNQANGAELAVVAWLDTHLP